MCTVLKDIFCKSRYALIKGIVEKKTQKEIIKTLPTKTRKKLPSFLIRFRTIFLIKFHLKDKEKELRILISVPGIGFIIASNLLAEIGNIHDFPTADKLAKWAGISPSVYQSINTNYTGPSQNRVQNIFVELLLNVHTLRLKDREN